MEKRHKVLLVIAILFGVFVGICIYTYIVSMFQSTKDANFDIDRGQGTFEIANSLKKEGLIKSPLVFALYTFGRHWYLQSGSYQIKKGMTALDIANLFHEGRVNEYLVSIPEGWRVTQIDDELANKKMIKAGEFLKIASSYEGKLFPDTYRFPLDVKVDEIKNEMYSNFEKKTALLNLSKENLILASIVEREAKFDEDRPKIAGIYIERLEKNMKLEADPTIQYAKGSWGPITAYDYQNYQSEYNTYLHNGLPPTPICNPGIKSIEAVLKPQKNGNLYFFHLSDGKTIYSKTYEEHQSNLEKYH